MTDGQTDGQMDRLTNIWTDRHKETDEVQYYVRAAEHFLHNRYKHELRLY